MRFSIFCVFAFSLSMTAAEANEQLLAAMPPGYHKISSEQKSAAMITVEMLPNGETRNRWTEMVTTLTFPGMGFVSPEKYRLGMQQVWDTYCPGGGYTKLKEQVEHGYPTLTWLWSCPGKPEWSWFKAIQGRDNLYSVQRALRFEPSAAVREEIARYFDSVRVCDLRLPDRPCR
jgi:hypothetical protein